jgi:hypothetical protein
MINTGFCGAKSVHHNEPIEIGQKGSVTYLLRAPWRLFVHSGHCGIFLGKGCKHG